MLKVSDKYVLHLCLPTGKNQSSVKGHFHPALVSSQSATGKILNKKKREEMYKLAPFKIPFHQNPF